MSPNQPMVPLSIEVNEHIYKCMQDFLLSNPGWNRSMLIEVSMSLFLVQNNHCSDSENQLNFSNPSFRFNYRADKYKQN